MNILLIAPSSGAWRRNSRRRLRNGRTFRFSLLSLLTVAAETPSGHRIRLVDEQVEDIPWTHHVDLVGITCMTALAPRAYEIADCFRQRGVPVVLGGMHPTFCPEEALEHANAVVAGEAEGVWPRVVEDARQGRLGGVYRADEQVELTNLNRPPRVLLDPRRYATVNAVQATRGCPHRCAFCSVSAFNGGVHRRRPVEDVAAEVASLPGRFFLFVDDNLTADADYARLLFEAIAPLRKLWVTQSTIAVARDEELVRAAARAGCFGLFVGLETFQQDSLDGAGKAFNRTAEYREAIRLLHGHGIGIEAGLVFGLDGHRPDVFRETLESLDNLGVDIVQVSIFTPLPGTPAFERYADRIFDHDWGHYDFHHAVFHPRGMSAEKLQAGHDWITRSFYLPTRIARRVTRHAFRPRSRETLRYVAAMNAAYRTRVNQWGLRGWDPGEKQAPGMRARLRGAGALAG